MKLPKLNIVPWWLKLAVPVGGLILLVVIVLNWWAMLKTKITHEHEEYKAAVWAANLCDSLHTVSEQSLAAAQYELLQKDSSIASYKEREDQHQVNNYELKKQLGVYRRDNRVCYKQNIFGKVIEVPCAELNFKDPP